VSLTVLFLRSGGRSSGPQDPTTSEIHQLRNQESGRRFSFSVPAASCEGSRSDCSARKSDHDSSLIAQIMGRLRL
jgi:hypothetical protein